MMKSIYICFGLILVFQLFFSNYSSGQSFQMPRIIAYYHGDTGEVEKYEVEKLTHIIYSFLHLKGNFLYDTPSDSAQLSKLIKLKQRNPGLKVLISLGGWGGCETCPVVFSTNGGRQDFSNSVNSLLLKYGADGIDLDWEYPALPSIPGHPYSSDDKQNFTALLKVLRGKIGENYEISFAAGGFEDFLTKSVEWEKVMPLVNYVNLMNYDIVNGNSTHTGHHTPLYSNSAQKESTDFTVNFLRKKGIPSEKIIIGAAFYGRLFSEVDSINNGIYRSGKFKSYVNYKDINKIINAAEGYEFFYDEEAKACWAYNMESKIFGTFDDKISVKLKAQYVLDNKLGGIMFWSLNGDVYSGGLLETIYNVINERKKH